MNLSNLFRLLLTTSIFPLLLACEKEVTRSDAPNIGYSPSTPFIYVDGSEVQLAELVLEDDFNKNIPFYYAVERISYSDSLNTKSTTQAKAYSSEIKNGSKLVIASPFNTSSKPGIYQLEVRAGDYQSNSTSIKQNFIYHPSISPDQEITLTPFGQSDTATYWELPSSDTLYFKKFTVSNPIGIKGISLFTLPISKNEEPSLIGALRLLTPSVSFRLDQLGGIPYFSTNDTLELIISLDDANGNSILYSHPTVFR